MPASFRLLSLTRFLLLLTACLWLLPAFAALPSISAVTLTVSPAVRGVVNTPVALTASAVTATQPEYKFRAGYQDATGWHWSEIRDYGVATCNWTPTQARTYTLVVYAREHGHTVAYEAYTAQGYLVVAPLTAVNITDSPVSQSLVGAPIKLTALPVGGARVEYKFRAGYQDAAGWHWSELTNYQTTTTCTWTPTMARSYRLTVYARESGRTTAYDVYNYLTHVVKTPLTAVALTATPAAPKVLNTPITLTAAPNGGGNVEYRFRAGYQDAAGWRWSDLQGYSTAANCQWRPEQARLYTLVVWAREVGHTVNYDLARTLSYRVTTPLPLNSVSLAASPESPQAAASPITLQATPTGGWHVEYQFRVGRQDTSGWQWTMLQAFNSQPSCQWSPTEVCDYTLEVTAREVGDASHQFTATLPFQITPSLTPMCAPLADAMSLNHYLGANLVYLTRPSNRVIAYIIYRDSNPFAPIAVIDGNSAYYLDSANQYSEQGLVMETITTDIEISDRLGEITAFNNTATYDTTLDTLHTTDMTLEKTSFRITSHFVPLQPGETCGYQVQVLYVDNETTDIALPSTYKLALSSRSAISSRVTLTEPPFLYTPATDQLPTDGIFRCGRVPAALGYNLQVSSNPTFAPADTVNVVAHIESEIDATAYYSFNDLFARFPMTSDSPIFWRMGARIEGQPNPIALSDTNQNGYVYSQTSMFMLPAVPPAPLGK